MYSDIGTLTKVIVGILLNLVLVYGLAKSLAGLSGRGSDFYL